LLQPSPKKMASLFAMSQPRCYAKRSACSTPSSTGRVPSSVARSRRCRHAASRLKNGTCETMSLPGFRVALPRATNWRVDLRLDPRLESSATTASRSHQAARRHLIDILGRRFAAEKWDMRGRCPSRVFESRCCAQSIGGSTSGLTQDWKAPLPPRPAPAKPHAATSSTSSDAASRLKNGTCETMSLPGFRIALMRATNWRVDLRLDPRLESSATTASRSHQAARRHLIDILGRRFAAEEWDMRDDVPPRFSDRAAARVFTGSKVGRGRFWAPSGG
jgi:hypothetical protein